jgi:hypothetical protein
VKIIHQPPGANDTASQTGLGEEISCKNFPRIGNARALIRKEYGKYLWQSIALHKKFGPASAAILVGVAGDFRNRGADTDLIIPIKPSISAISRARCRT